MNKIQSASALLFWVSEQPGVAGAHVCMIQYPAPHHPEIRVEWMRNGQKYSIQRVITHAEMVHSNIDLEKVVFSQLAETLKHELDS